MAGDILQKQQASLQTIGSTTGTLATGTAALMGTVDARSGGNMANLFAALYTLSAQWATVTGIAANTTIADLYLVPAIDDTTPAYPDIDTSAASYIPFPMRVGTFVASKAPTVSTDMLFQSQPSELMPMLYRAYIINRSGQTISTGATLKARGAAAQYT